MELLPCSMKCLRNTPCVAAFHQTSAIESERQDGIRDGIKQYTASDILGIALSKSYPYNMNSRYPVHCSAPCLDGIHAEYCNGCTRGDFRIQTSRRRVLLTRVARTSTTQTVPSTSRTSVRVFRQLFLTGPQTPVRRGTLQYCVAVVEPMLRMWIGSAA